jgi:glycosyltransferase involved in cell wall biosynthesis
MTRSLYSRIRDKISGVLVTTYAKALVSFRTKHVSGNKQITVGADDVVLVSLVKDAEYYLEKLIDHHRALGVKHILLIDNGSTDRTRELFVDADDVSVFLNTLPVKRFECLLRSRIARRFVKGGWFLFVDSDELVSFGRGQGRHISQFAAYCNMHNYDAVIGQCLDLFSPFAIETTSDWSYADSVRRFDQYSLEDISYYDYFDAENIDFSWFLKDNAISNHDIKFMFGGIRNEVFGENCCLTTHRMVRNKGGIDLYSHAHCSGNVHCADFAFLIQHYKFCGNLLERDLAIQRNMAWDHGENAKRISRLQSEAGFVISGRNQQLFVDTEDLISKGFLACSDRYLQQFPKIE